MKKTGIFLVIIILNIILIFAEVRINEIELNPEGTDDGKEWIELYSSETIDLNNWKIINEDDKTINLSGNFDGYYVINLDSQFLDNENESLRLYNGENIISFTPVLKDDLNDNKTWTYCNPDWILISSTKEEENNCLSVENNITQNETNNTSNEQENEEEEIELDLYWDDEDIINGEEFEIEVKVYNLKDEYYDLKIFIYDSDIDKPITQTQDSDDDWISSNNYIKELFDGPGEYTKYIKLKIKDSSKEFYGGANIVARLREKDSSSYKVETIESIEIIEREEEESDEEFYTSDNNKDYDLEREKVLNEINTKKDSSITGDAIYLKKPDTKKLKTESIKTQKNIVYESNDEVIKRYLLISSILLLSILGIILGLGYLR